MATTSAIRQVPNGSTASSTGSTTTTATTTTTTTTTTALGIGILGMEVYIPKLYINQTALEEQMLVPTGKYTIGLGQHNLSIPCGDVEDINSICLTVVTNLLQK
jgi:hypothetical protein